MKRYVIKKITEENEVESARALKIDFHHKTAETDVAAKAQICYTDEALIVRLTAKEKDIRAKEPRTRGMPCNDSCLEFFFCPEYGDLTYFNLEFSPKCSLYLGYRPSGQRLKRLWDDEANADELFAPKAELTKDGWRITYRVPFSFVRKFFPDFAPVSGTKIKANCYKCGDKTPKRHFLTWNPIPDEVNFHCPEHFGLMVFE